MPNIEQAALLAGPFMALPYTEVAILDRHRVAAKWDHFAAICNMKIIESGAIGLN